MGVVIGEGIFQVWWLKRFFEVKDPSRPSFNKGALGLRVYIFRGL